MTLKVLRRAREDLRYYKIDNHLVKIYAVLGDRRDPKMIETRLEEEK